MIDDPAVRQLPRPAHFDQVDLNAVIASLILAHEAANGGQIKYLPHTVAGCASRTMSRSATRRSIKPAFVTRWRLGFLFGMPIKISSLIGRRPRLGRREARTGRRRRGRRRLFWRWNSRPRGGRPKVALAVGRSPDPRRTPQARHRHWSNLGRQIYGKAEEAPISGLEDVPLQPRRWDRPWQNGHSERLIGSIRRARSVGLDPSGMSL